MKMNRLSAIGLFGIMGASLMMCSPSMVFADSISPTSFSDTLAVGESVTITKTVTVEGAGAPKVDVYFMADTTGSMGGAISGVKSSAAAILSSTAGLGDVAFAVGEYKDYYQYRYRLNTAMTTNQASAQAGINMWSASGGNDAPEANMFALEQAAGAGTGWRAGSERILVWFGDAPGHSPSGSSTEASATAALVGAGIQVEAINITTFTSYGFNLDLCSTSYYCGATAEGGAATSGQATRITTATGGNLHTGTNSSAIVSVIQNAINTAFSSYSSVGLDLSEAPAGVTLSASPASYSGTWDRSTSHSFDFDLTFTGVTPGTYDFSVYGTVDGGRIATETDHIVVAAGSTSVPEPGTLLLVGSGMIGFAFARRKRASKAANTK